MESVKFDYSNALKFVDEKTIKEYGSHKELMKIKAGIYRNMFETQAKQYRKK